MKSRTAHGHNKKARKAKKSFTLSAESVEFLESMRKTQRAASVSAVLDEMLQYARREAGKTALDKAVADYYSSLAAEEVEEGIAWREFAMREFPTDRGETGLPSDSAARAEVLRS
jgi:hypothetical protein